MVVSNGKLTLDIIKSGIVYSGVSLGNLKVFLVSSGCVGDMDYFLKDFANKY